MNCIFICIFDNENYVDMFYLLLGSIQTYGNLSDDIDIVVYTSTKFMNYIKTSRHYGDYIKFELNDNYDTLDKACKARLDLFSLSSISKYEKILYLDTDIIVKDDIHKVFNVVTSDILYVLEEGRIDHGSNYWGMRLFGDEADKYEDKNAFTTGIMAFNNCKNMHFLFEKVNEMIRNPEYDVGFLDQAHIIYNAFKYGLFDNKTLKTLAVNNDFNFKSDKVIHHFPGAPGRHYSKINAMMQFLKK